MKNKTIKSMMALLLAATMLMSTACGQTSKESAEETNVSGENSVVPESSSTTEEVVDKGKLPVITMFPASASLTSGMVDGHRSDFFAENGFQMEVWAFSQEKKMMILSLITHLLSV